MSSLGFRVAMIDPIRIADIGMNLVSVTAGTFTMGSPNAEKGRDSDEGPETEVTLTQSYWLGETEVTQRQWEEIMGNNPSNSKGGNRPVESVTWNDAMEFCRRLTTRERAAGRLDGRHEYTLPTEAQWEYACRAGTITRFSFGDDAEYTQLGNYAWYASNSGQTHDVAQKLANPWGLYDMHGNVWEWCLDWYSGSYPGGNVADPRGSSSGVNRLLRGGGFADVGRTCRSAYRRKVGTDPRHPIYRGFRVALVFLPKLFLTDSGIELILIPSGTFTMGSPTSEKDRDGDDEGPQTEVTLSQDFWLGKTEVTQRQWQSIMGSNPSRFKGEERPVESVSWDEAMEFCINLTFREQKAERLPAGYEYALPTEAQWEYACRAGMVTRFPYGDDFGYKQLGKYAWYLGNSDALTHDVEGKLENQFGLYDMHGNVWEWCLDWYSGSYPGGNVTDPKGPSSGVDRVLRGGGWSDPGRHLRSSDRSGTRPYNRRAFLGFRVSLVPVSN